MSVRRRIVTVVGAAAAALICLLPAVANAEPGFSTATQIPSPISTPSSFPNRYGAISCYSASSCTAVGPSSVIAYATKATAITDDAGIWSRVSLPLPFATLGVALDGVACASAGDCTAVGGARAAVYERTLVETESSGSWSASTVTPPSGIAGMFESLWCASQSACVATGFYSGSNGDLAAMVAVETAGTWAKATALPVPAIRGVTFLLPYALACSDVDDCTVLAFADDSGGTRAISWTESAGSWGPAVAVPRSRGLSFLGESIQCPTATTCLAVGFLDDRRRDVLRPASAEEVSGSWSTPVALSLPKLSPVVDSGSFSSLGCTSTSCEAVGTFTSSSAPDGSVAGAATWDNGTWSSIGLIRNVRLVGRSSGNLAGDAELWAVSCGAAAACVGAGTFGDTRPSGDFAASITPQRPVTVPQAPEDAVGDPGARRALLSWTPPLDDGGAPVRRFTATVEPGGARCTTPTYHCIIGGLVDGRQYVVLVTASNSAGQGPVARGRFVDGGPPTVPRAFHVVSWSTHDALTVRWDPSTPPPGMRVTSYDLSIARGDHVVRSAFTEKTTCRFGGLVAHRRYTLTLSANDVSGGSSVVLLHVVAP